MCFIRTEFFFRPLVVVPVIDPDSIAKMTTILATHTKWTQKTPFTRIKTRREEKNRIEWEE